MGRDGIRENLPKSSHHICQSFVSTVPGKEFTVSAGSCGLVCVIHEGA